MIKTFSTCEKCGTHHNQYVLDPHTFAPKYECRKCGEKWTWCPKSRQRETFT